jgi:hypothetical protein
MNKTQFIKIRISPVDKKIMKNKAARAGVKISEYLRNLGLYSKSTLIYDELLIKEVKRIGVNINQIARAVNQGFWSHDIQISLERILEDLRKELKLP